MKLTVLFSIFIIAMGLWAEAMSCDSCGRECAAACGTRHFRTCCFNYLRRKRMPASLSPAGLRFQLWMKQGHAKEDKGKRFYNFSPGEQSWSTYADDVGQLVFEDPGESRFQLIYDA